ncbi:unnamed protein product, partial [Ectocarpus sp. 12 AP-2014]
MKPARLDLDAACQSSLRCTNRVQVVSHEVFFLHPFSRPGECDMSFRRSVLWQSTWGDAPPPRCFLLPLFFFSFALVSAPCRSLFIQKQTRCVYDRLVRRALFTALLYDTTGTARRSLSRTRGPSFLSPGRTVPSTSTRRRGSEATA